MLSPPCRGRKAHPETGPGRRIRTEELRDPDQMNRAGCWYAFAEIVRGER
jgi:hypothetical protein